jgi:hypothetical protein
VFAFGVFFEIDLIISLFFFCSKNITLFFFSFLYFQGIYHRLGDIFARLQQWSEAERFQRAAIEAQPDHIGAHISYGTMLAKNVSLTFFSSLKKIFYLFFVFFFNRQAVQPKPNNGSKEQFVWHQPMPVSIIITVS